MYVDEKIPLTYKYVAELGDNYVILVDSPIIYSDGSYIAYVQYFNPSTQVLVLHAYCPTKGNIYNYDFNYRQDNENYSYIDNVEQTFSIHLSEIEVEHYENVFTRQDYSNIILVVWLILGLYILIWNLASSLVHRGGIFSD